METGLPEKFGNYALQGMEEIVLPSPVSWFPHTLAWLLVAILLATGLIYVGVRRWQRYRRNRYRREALALLASWQEQEDASVTIQRLPALLRGVALRSYSRELITPLTGRPWLEFLAQHCPESKLLSSVGEQLLIVSYQSKAAIELSDAAAAAMVEQCRIWIRSHRVDL